MRVYRVQDAQGRGPYKPGMTANWVDDNDVIPPPTWMSEFGPELLTKVSSDEYVGCGVRHLDQLARWFSPTEMPRLRALDYRLVALSVDRILAESPNQVVFARRKPLSQGATILRFPDQRY